MKSFLKIIFLLLPVVSHAEITNTDEFIERYPQSFQDVFIENKTVLKGISICSPRYEILKEILDQYKGNFKVLDIGAAQGYFSLRIANDYPNANCVMIEGDNYYKRFEGMLENICYLNNYLDNIFFLNKSIKLKDLVFLNENEHFDVVIAYLVIHQLASDDSRRSLIFEEILKLGDNVIVEVSTDLAPTLAEYIENYSHQIPCQYIGELKRMYNSNGMGKFYWFSNKRLTKEDLNKHEPQTISPETFEILNGIYPPDFWTE